MLSNNEKNIEPQLKFCFKKPNQRLQFEISQQNQTIETLEGPIRCNSGDYIMTGVKDEKWPLKPAKFHQTYDIDDNLAVPKLTIKQYLDNQQLIYSKTTVPWGKNGEWIEVECTKEHILITDFNVSDQKTYQYPCVREIFQKTYVTSDNELEIQQKLTEHQQISQKNTSSATAQSSTNTRTLAEVELSKTQKPLKFSSRTIRNLEESRISRHGKGKQPVISQIFEKTSETTAVKDDKIAKSCQKHNEYESTSSSTSAF